MKRVIGIAGLAVAVGLSGCGVARFMDRSAVVTEPSPCTARRFEVYFADSEARLTESARQAIGMEAAQLQGCEIRKVQVLGLADARGGATANLDLSERRATRAPSPTAACASRCAAAPRCWSTPRRAEIFPGATRRRSSGAVTEAGVDG